ncbi:MAG TPA: DUF3570 domain-containing protein [Burkholderiaceae bacterium]|nr:DUF3570 domain-containing protein [Burkholderiaceae bacterium]
MAVTNTSGLPALLGRWRLALLAVAGRRRVRLPYAAAAHMLGALAGLLAAGTARAAELPEDRADVMYHYYDGGGTRASGPAVLVRKSIADKVSLSGSYYLDMVSNASIDVVTTASPYKESRHEEILGLDYVYRDATITLSGSNSSEPDYIAKSFGIDVAQEVFGGLTTISMGYTRGWDKVGKKGEGFFDNARHWHYRLGASQILTPHVLVSANFEAISDDGFLGSPYRVARELSGYVPENVPRTRTSRALKLSAIDDLGTIAHDTLRAQYRYFWDTWDIRSSTLELGYSRYFGSDVWLGDAYLRYYTQSDALFYSDDASELRTYVTRNRQLSAFKSYGLGTRVAYTAKRVPGQYEIKLNGALERTRFNFSDFTDVRTGSLYSYDATIVQMFVSATF